MRILRALWNAAERYIRIGFGLLDPDPHEHKRREQAHETLIATFRQGTPKPPPAPSTHTSTTTSKSLWAQPVAAGT
jgi:hypothetical protein